MCPSGKFSSFRAKAIQKLNNRDNVSVKLILYCEGDNTLFS